jgi:iron complex transport system ATP-binding protein
MQLAKMLIELHDVCIQRETTRILDHLNLDIPTGQNVAILGPNGSGKSTLLKLLMKFFYPSVVDGESGTVRILGQEAWNVWELRKHLGFVSADIDQHFRTGRSARLTALQSVLTGFASSELEPDPESITSDMLAGARQCLRLFQVNELSQQCIGHMSTGERRRVLLARALVKKPPAIILDEPTSGLDLVARSKLLNELSQLACSGTQLVLVTHHLEEILPTIQRTILLKHGRIFRDGPTDEVLDSETISELFDTQVTLDRDRDGFFRAFL